MGSTGTFSLVYVPSIFRQAGQQSAADTTRINSTRGLSLNFFKATACSQKINKSALQNGQVVSLSGDWLWQIEHVCTVASPVSGLILLCRVVLYGRVSNHPLMALISSRKFLDVRVKDVLRNRFNEIVIGASIKYVGNHFCRIECR